MPQKKDNEKETMNNVPYASTIGRLMYAVLCTQPDICYAVGLINHLTDQLGFAHRQAIKKIMRYLHGITDLVLCYQGRDLALGGYSDADRVSDVDESRSTSGYVFILDGGAI